MDHDVQNHGSHIKMQHEIQSYDTAHVQRGRRPQIG